MKHFTTEQILQFAKNYTKSAHLSHYQKGLVSGGIVIGATWLNEQIQTHWIPVTDQTDLDRDQFYYVALKDGKVAITMYVDWWWQENVTDYAIIPQIDPPKH